MDGGRAAEFRWTGAAAAMAGWLAGWLGGWLVSLPEDYSIVLCRELHPCWFPAARPLPTDPPVCQHVPSRLACPLSPVLNVAALSLLPAAGEGPQRWRRRS